LHVMVYTTCLKSMGVKNIKFANFMNKSSVTLSIFTN
jgi:hypothetical protein